MSQNLDNRSIYDIFRACRLCGAGGGYKMPIIPSVVGFDCSDIELRQKIRECLQIEVNQDDKMPPLICELCVDKVNDFFEFLEMCRLTNSKTRQRLGLPLQPHPKDVAESDDCILGVTEPVYLQDDDNEPLSKKTSRNIKIKKEEQPKKVVLKKEYDKVSSLRRELESLTKEVPFTEKTPSSRSRSGRSRRSTTPLASRETRSSSSVTADHERDNTPIQIMDSDEEDNLPVVRNKRLKSDKDSKDTMKRPKLAMKLLPKDISPAPKPNTRPGPMSSKVATPSHTEQTPTKNIAPEAKGSKQSAGPKSKRPLSTPGPKSLKRPASPSPGPKSLKRPVTPPGPKSSRRLVSPVPGPKSSKRSTSSSPSPGPRSSKRPVSTSTDLRSSKRLVSPSPGPRSKRQITPLPGPKSSKTTLSPPGPRPSKRSISPRLGPRPSKRALSPSIGSSVGSRSSKISLSPSAGSRSSKKSLSPSPGPRSSKRQSSPLPASKPSKRNASPALDEVSNRCNVCGSVYQTPQGYGKHMKSVHLVKFTANELACNPCGEWFTSAEEVSAHHKQHRSKHRPYTCRGCYEEYKLLPDYNQHVSETSCVPWYEVPDLECPECWGKFPTRVLLETHSCAGQAARPAGKCSKCNRSYQTLKGLTKHESTCGNKKKGSKPVPGAAVDAQVSARLLPVQVRMSRCDELLDKKKRCLASRVPSDFGLDRNCTYPYRSLVRVKQEPLAFDSMVSINKDVTDEFYIEEEYVHWDSGASSDSDGEYSLLNPTAKSRRVPSLTTLTLKTVFSKQCLGKVPRKLRKVREEKYDTFFNPENEFDNVRDDMNSDINNIISNLGAGNDGEIKLSGVMSIGSVGGMKETPSESDSLLDIPDDKFGTSGFNKGTNPLSDSVLDEAIAVSDVNFGTNGLSKGTNPLSDSVLHEAITISDVNFGTNGLSKGTNPLSDSVLHEAITISDVNFGTNGLSKGTNPLSDSVLDEAITISDVNFGTNGLNKETNPLSDSALHEAITVSDVNFGTSSLNKETNPLSDSVLDEAIAVPDITFETSDLNKETNSESDSLLDILKTVDDKENCNLNLLNSEEKSCEGLLNNTTNEHGSETDASEENNTLTVAQRTNNINDKVANEKNLHSNGDILTTDTNSVEKTNGVAEIGTDITNPSENQSELMNALDDLYENRLIDELHAQIDEKSKDIEKEGSMLGDLVTTNDGSLTLDSISDEEFNFND